MAPCTCRCLNESFWMADGYMHVEAVQPAVHACTIYIIHVPAGRAYMLMAEVYMNSLHEYQLAACSGALYSLVR